MDKLFFSCFMWCSNQETSPSALGRVLRHHLAKIWIRLFLCHETRVTINVSLKDPHHCFSTSHFHFFYQFFISNSWANYSDFGFTNDSHLPSNFFQPPFDSAEGATALGHCLITGVNRIQIPGKKMWYDMTFVMCFCFNYFCYVSCFLLWYDMLWYLWWYALIFVIIMFMI